MKFHRLLKRFSQANPKKVSEALKVAPNSLDQPVRAKSGERAWFTPLILAAALADQQITEMLVERGANITALDDYNRSALWYAAFREDVGVTKLLIRAKSAGDVINAADNVFR